MKLPSKDSRFPWFLILAEFIYDSIPEKGKDALGIRYNSDLSETEKENALIEIIEADTRSKTIKVNRITKILAAMNEIEEIDRNNFPIHRRWQRLDRIYRKIMDSIKIETEVLP